MDTIDQIHEIQENLLGHKIIFFYSGYITEDLLMSVGNTIKKKFALVQADRKDTRAVFAVFVEEVQNIIRYSKAVLNDQSSDSIDQEEKEALRHGFLSIGKADQRYFVCCGNLVLNADVETMESHLLKIQSLDADGLKKFYKERLKEGPPEGSKGAGIGFVDIARRAKGGIEFKFKDVDDSHKYFYLKAYI